MGKQERLDNECNKMEKQGGKKENERGREHTKEERK